MKRYLFIGSVDYSAHCLKALLDMKVDIVDILCPVKAAAAGNSDYVDLKTVAQEHSREVHYFKNIADEEEYIRNKKPDVIFVLGLSQIVPPSILSIPTIGCIGSHPALLPQNRGRHPIVWSLVNGLEKSGVTLFWLDEGVDSGDIWVQKEFNIDLDDDAGSLYNKSKDITVELLQEYLSELESGEAERIPQDHSQANYWPKRGFEDGEIDWKMGSKKIYDLIRALTNPYVGAHCRYQGNVCKIWKAQLVNTKIDLKDVEPGEVVGVNGDEVAVKTGDGVLKLVKHELSPLPKVGKRL